MVLMSHRSGTGATRAVLGAPRSTRVGRRSLVALAGLIGAFVLVGGLGGVSTSVAAAADPSYAWATQGGGTGNGAHGVSALADGSSIITGKFTGTSTFGATTLISAGLDDVFTAKLNADGSYAWATQGGGTGTDGAHGVSALPDGSSIITGYFSGTASFGSTTLTSAGLDDVFTAKLNADGSYAWATRAGGAGVDIANAVSALADGSSIITGSFGACPSSGSPIPCGTATFGDTTLTSAAPVDIFTAKLNADGTYAWATKGGIGIPTTYGSGQGLGVSALADGSSIITGSFSGSATFGDTPPLVHLSAHTFTAKLNADGTYAWVIDSQGPAPLGQEVAMAVSALADGSSIITGLFLGTTATFGSTTLTNTNTNGSSDTFTAKVNADGTYAWATKAGGSGSDYARGVSALPDGSSIITGIFSDTATFGATTLTSAGGYDAFTAKVNADGTYAWAIRGGGSGSDYASGVSALSDGSSIITGQFSGTATFGTTAPLTSAGEYLAFTARIVADAHVSASSAVTPTAPVNTFTMKILKHSAQSITTQLNLSGPGKVVLVGTTPQKAATMIVCRARKTVAKAGKVTIICRLTAKARAARKTQSLKVRLVATFTPTGGTAKRVSRTLVLKETQYRPEPVTG